MTDNAGYRPTDDSALRWEDCHCTQCGQPDKKCECVALTPGTKPTPTSNGNDDLVIKVADLLYSLGWRAPGDAQWDHLKGHLPELRELLGSEPPYAHETCEQRAPVERALARRVYLKSERDMSGYRVVIGFDTLTDVQAAHQEVADIPKAPTQKASEGPG